MSNKQAKARAPMVRYDFSQWENFVRVWQKSESVEKAAETLGLTVTAAQSKASTLRRLGVELRKWHRTGARLGKPEVDKLKAIARAAVYEATVKAPPDAQRRAAQ